jgi:F-type H+-transporting ATPase subunit b
MRFDLVTFLFELLNFALLGIVLARFVFRPIAAAIAERRAALRDQQARADAHEAAAAAERRALDQRSAALDGLREEVLAEATADAARARARMLAQAREEAAAERARVETLLQTERAAALEWVREAAVAQGAAVAGRMMGALAPEALHGALLGRLGDAVRERARALGEDPVDEVELSVARLPTDEALAPLRAALEAALGQRPRVRIDVDERLLAGAVLRVGDRVLDASVQGQLHLLQEEALRGLRASA